jgi:hypothetical protein
MHPSTRSGLGGVLYGVGQALMRRSEMAREDDLIARQDARQDALLTREETRQDALLTRQEAREDVMMQRQEAIARAREIRQDMMRAAERGEDREFQGELADRQMAHQSELAGAERELMTTRFDREDRRAIEDHATEQMVALDNRIQDLQDMQLKGEVLGEEGEVERQIAEATEQKLAIRGQLVERLYEMGDARYKDMPADQRLYAAGYSKDQVVAFMRMAGQDPGEAEAAAAPEPEAPSGPSDDEVAATVRGTDPARVAKYGLSADDRAALGLEAEAPAVPAMRAPESPPPLRDMTQAGRGRRVGTVNAGNSRFNTNPADPLPEILSTALKPRVDTGNPRAVAAAAARNAPKAAEPEKPKAPDPKETQATSVSQAVELLLKPYGGDISKAPAGVVAAVNVLRQKLRE